MKTGKSMTIAVVVPKLANMFSMRVIESVESELEKFGYSVIVADCGGSDISEKKQLTKLIQLKNKMVDGIVLMPVGDCAKEVKDIIGSTPLVLIDRLFSDNIFDSVVINNEQTAYRQATKILQGDIKKVGIIKGPQEITTARDRTKGYNRAIKEANILPQNIFSYDGDYTSDSGYNAMKNLLLHDVDVVLISNYELTIGAINCINEEQRSKQVTLLGFDSLELANLVKQPYLFISQPIEEIGELAAKLLLDRINNNDSDNFGDDEKQDVINKVIEVKI